MNNNDGFSETKNKDRLKWMKSKDKREENIFFSLCEDKTNTIKKSKFKEALLESGLTSSDHRLKPVFSNIDALENDEISFNDFVKIIRQAGLLVEKALRGELAIPDFKDFSKTIDKIFDEVSMISDGELASYIPPLAKVNPDQFGVAIVTVDGQVYQRGDSSCDFSVQSMCKPFNYCFALEEHGLEEVHKHVGHEPSGRFFNDLSLLKQSQGGDIEESSSQVPFNPMINAGAIMTCGLIKQKESNTERLNFIRGEFGKLIGVCNDTDSSIEIPRFNKEMARQENFKGYNNLALGYLLMATGNLPHKEPSLGEDPYEDNDEYEFYIEPAVTAALKIYFSICSLEFSAKDIAMAAATLANRGVCPVTQQRVLKQETVRNCLPIIQMCGMYNGSGAFFQDIGLPAKSGVGGGVFLVVPNLMGICIFSPKLDAYGNSVRGIEMARRITQKYLLHLFDGLMTDTNRIDPRLPFSKWLAASCSESIWAASTGCLRTLEKLSNEQHDLESGDYDGRTPLHLASAEGHVEAVKFLLNHGVKPKADRWGGYPISDAQNNNHQVIVDIFNQLDIDYKEPYHHIADPEGETDTPRRFDNELMVVEFLWSASTNNSVNMCQLIAQGIPIDAADYDLRTALHLAAAEGHLDAVKYLVSHGHPLHVRDRWGATPFDEAIREKRTDVIDYMKKIMT